MDFFCFGINYNCQVNIANPGALSFFEKKTHHGLWGIPKALNFQSFFIFLFRKIRYHGPSSSIKCHVCHHVGWRRHTLVVCNEKRKPNTSHYPSKQVTTKNIQPATHTSHYLSRLVETSFKKAAMIYRF